MQKYQIHSIYPTYIVVTSYVINKLNDIINIHGIPGTIFDLQFDNIDLYMYKVRIDTTHFYPSIQFPLKLECNKCGFITEHKSSNQIIFRTGITKYDETRTLIFMISDKTVCKKCLTDFSYWLEIETSEPNKINNVDIHSTGSKIRHFNKSDITFDISP